MLHSTYWSLPMFWYNLSVPCPIFKGEEGTDMSGNITNYPSTMRNIPEERRSHLHHSRSLKSCNVYSNCLWPTIVW